MHSDTDATLWTTIAKTADETVTSSTAVQDDDELQFATVDDGVYEFEALILQATPTGGGTPDFRLTFQEGSLDVSTAFVATGMSTADSTSSQAGLGGTELAFGANSFIIPINVRGHHVGGGGTFKFRWAQNTSSSNGSVVYAGSILRYRRVL